MSWSFTEEPNILKNKWVKTCNAVTAETHHHRTFLFFGTWLFTSALWYLSTVSLLLFCLAFILCKRYKQSRESNCMFADIYWNEAREQNKWFKSVSRIGTVRVMRQGSALWWHQSPPLIPAHMLIQHTNYGKIQYNAILYRLCLNTDENPSG